MEDYIKEKMKRDRKEKKEQFSKENKYIFASLYIFNCS